MFSSFNAPPASVLRQLQNKTKGYKLKNSSEIFRFTNAVRETVNQNGAKQKYFGGGLENHELETASHAVQKAMLMWVAIDECWQRQHVQRPWARLSWPLAPSGRRARAAFLNHEGKPPGFAIFAREPEHRPWRTEYVVKSRTLASWFNFSPQSTSLSSPGPRSCPQKRLCTFLRIPRKFGTCREWKPWSRKGGFGETQHKKYCKTLAVIHIVNSSIEYKFY
jgi:hypothetical protein